ncbi:hypothetical protein K1X76_07240 [bacterium]|nr:hypothetical protein [bacterium]
MKKIIFILLLFVSFPANAKTKTITSPEFDTMLQLKVYMQQFVDSYSNLEEELRNNAKPNWQKADEQLVKMKDVIFEIKKEDGKKAYHGNLSELDAVLNLLTQKIAKKDTTIGETLDALSNTCLKCHLTHRRMDVEKVNLMKGAT